MDAENLQAEAGRPRRLGRRGRPKAEQAGEVDRRIIDAASDLFLRLGYDAASCDQVAILAQAGKASLYARYANKEALFQAVVRDKVARTLGPSTDVPWEQPLRKRLQVVGEALLIHVLQPEPVAFMRVVFTAAHRMPDLAKQTMQIGREGGVRCLARAIVGQPDVSAEGLERARPLAAKFLDLAFVPHQMRALIGDEPAVLEADAASRVADAIDLLSHAGWLDPWEP